MPPQLKTLIPLFAIFVGLFLTARYFLVPESYGQFGHYRGNSLKDNAEKSISYAGKPACIECHDDINQKLEADLHAKLSCEVCHGPGAGHVQAPDSVILEKPGTRQACGTCHQKIPSRPAKAITQVNISEHHIEKKDCIECHNPHAVWELKQ